MSGKSKIILGSTKAASERGKRRIDRPFAPEIEARAKELAARYQVVIGLEADSGEYFGHCLELPGAMGDGKTPADCFEQVQTSAAALVGYLLEEGQTPPAPANEQVRDVQLNIRVSEAEKARIENYAQAQGMGVSDYVREAAVIHQGGGGVWFGKKSGGHTFTGAKIAGGDKTIYRSKGGYSKALESKGRLRK